MTDEYQRQVADIVVGQARASSYQPNSPQELFIKDRKLVLDLDGLDEQELLQVVPMFEGNDVLQILSEGDEGDGPINLEVANVVDECGIVRYRYWGMDFGALYLMAPDSLDIVAFTAQHHMEQWHADQRPLFWATDRAILCGGHGFQQMAQFCWWDDACWACVADKPRGSVGSEPSFDSSLRVDQSDVRRAATHQPFQRGEALRPSRSRGDRQSNVRSSKTGHYR